MTRQPTGERPDEESTEVTHTLRSRSVSCQSSLANPQRKSRPLYLHQLRTSGLCPRHTSKKLRNVHVPALVQWWHVVISFWTVRLPVTFFTAQATPCSRFESLLQGLGPVTLGLAFRSFAAALTLRPLRLLLLSFPLSLQRISLHLSA